MYHLTEAYLLAGLICLLAAYLGALLFSTIVVAPLIVRTLDGTDSSRLLRAYWPKIHAFAVIGGTVLTLIMAGSWSFSALPAVYAMAVIAAAGLMTMCFLGGWRLIPAINHARDQGNLDQFNRLHRFDVMLMLAGMLLALIVVIALVYVLPGQFTFSPTIAPTTAPSVLPMTA